MSKRKSLFEKHWTETLLSVVLLIGTGIAWANKRISADAAEIIDVITATLAISVAVLKDHFGKTAETLAAREHFLASRTGEISAILEELNGPSFDHAIRLVDNTLDWLRLIPQGTLRLDPSSYYNELTNALRNAKKGSNVFGVSSMPFERWESDPRQINYFDENAKAVKKGVAIHRVFIIDRSHPVGDYASRIKQVVLQQKAAKITVYLVWRESIKHDPALYDDFVLFDEANVVFTDEHEKADPTRVLAGYLVSEPKRILRYRGVIKSLTETYCLDQTSFDEFINSNVAGATNVV